MTITRAQIEMYASAADAEHMQELARMALAAMEAEPVGEVSEQRDGLILDGTVDLGGTTTHRIIKGASKMKRLPLGTKFYTAPQPLTTSERAELENYRNAQQVVPEWTNEQCLEFLSIAFRHAEIKGDLEMDDIRLGVKMVNACRAAMLQAGNSPVIPAGWVMVPVEPTAEMISAGIAAHYERAKIQIHDRPAPGPIECAYVAMVAAAPQQEADNG